MSDLTEELRGSGLCDTFRNLTKAHYNFEFGNCRPEDADEAADGLLVAKFDDRTTYRKHLRWDGTGCGGAMLYGPMWSIGPLREGEIQTVIDSVGGRVIGERERGSC
jgi:hypothetical protein